MLSDAVYDRVRTLKGGVSFATPREHMYDRADPDLAMYKLQNQNEKDQLSKFFYGLVGRCQ